jgi:hypothetical protein
MTRRWNHPGRVLGMGALVCTGVIAGSAAGVAGSGIGGPAVAGAAGGCGAG